MIRSLVVSISDDVVDGTRDDEMISFRALYVEGVTIFSSVASEIELELNFETFRLFMFDDSRSFEVIL